jgi:hypothetical protein
METHKGTLENDEEYYDKGKLDLEVELISALSDLKRERGENKSLKEELIKLKENYENPNKNYEEVQHVIINLKVQLEEARMIEETLKN